eukprot:5436527-Pleurochrysis_carterae.AAC.4
MDVARNRRRLKRLGRQVTLHAPEHGIPRACVLARPVLWSHPAWVCVEQRALEEAAIVAAAAGAASLEVVVEREAESMVTDLKAAGDSVLARAGMVAAAGAVGAATEGRMAKEGPVAARMAGAGTVAAAVVVLVAVAEATAMAVRAAARVEASAVGGVPEVPHRWQTGPQSIRGPHQALEDIVCSRSLPR